MYLAKDEFQNNITAFAPISSATYNGAVTVSKTTAVRLGADCVITINGVALTYLEGEVIVLTAGISYTFGTSTICHIM